MIRTDSFSYDGLEILIISWDPTTSVVDWYITGSRDDAWENLNSARATHNLILYCSDEELFKEHNKLS